MKFSIEQISWMAREVHRQKADPRYVEGMAFAVRYCSGIRPDKIRIEDLDIMNSAILMLGGVDMGFRTTPVTFQNGGASADASMIPMAVERHIRFVQQGQLDDHEMIDEWIKHLLWIHPYKDGNGRLASVLRNWLMGNFEHPLDLPDYDW